MSEGLSVNGMRNDEKNQLGEEMMTDEQAEMSEKRELDKIDEEGVAEEILNHIRGFREELSSISPRMTLKIPYKPEGGMRLRDADEEALSDDEIKDYLKRIVAKAGLSNSNIDENVLGEKDGFRVTYQAKNGREIEWKVEEIEK